MTTDPPTSWRLTMWLCQLEPDCGPWPVIQRYPKLPIAWPTWWERGELVEVP